MYWLDFVNLPGLSPDSDYLNIEKKIKMKFTFKLAAFTAILFTLIFASCKKDKKNTEPETPPTASEDNDPEVVTTVRIYIWDSITNTNITGSPFTFKDPDGDGGLPGGFLNSGTDSVITLTANTSYKTRLVILDETKNPADSTSNAIATDEGYEHMVFYNGDPSQSTTSSGNTIIKSGYPNYSVKLNGSDIRLRYSDSDNGAAHANPTRNIGLETFLKTSSANTVKFPFIVTLRHQPNAKDGTYAPGETDVSIAFKVKVN
ncbi:hypothetical protein CNR22_01305 [Sphingobacteriaceae bacterium]|nr:hypothetical protein CNR22_01305 [Sphingobacteriaceae bacterium]